MSIKKYSASVSFFLYNKMFNPSIFIGLTKRGSATKADIDR
jgi:hypothetical protein